MSNEAFVRHLPPPPPLPISNFGIHSAKTNRKDSILGDVPSSHSEWAQEFPELRKCCVRNGIFASKEPSRWRYRHFESLLQQGPTCGLVALCMLLRSRLFATDLLSIAKRAQHTINGEMFSAQAMLQLCLDVIDDQDKLKVELCRGNLASNEYVNCLLGGCLLLVPFSYDSDKNHSPCLKSGHSAHWALITGVLINRKSDDLDSVYVTAKHGKSLNVAAWKLSELAASNANLSEVSDTRLNDELTYIIPEGGLDGEKGLCNQFILIRHL